MGAKVTSTLVAVAATAAIAAAQAQAHPSVMPMAKGKQAIVKFGRGVADGQDFWYTGLRSCMHMRGAMVGCIIEWGFDTGTCTNAGIAHYVGRSSRITVFTNPDAVQCYSDGGGSGGFDLSPR